MSHGCGDSIAGLQCSGEPVTTTRTTTVISNKQKTVLRIEPKLMKPLEWAKAKELIDDPET